jgi:hypothetical protein
LWCCTNQILFSIPNSGHVGLNLGPSEGEADVLKITLAGLLQILCNLIYGRSLSCLYQRIFNTVSWLRFNKFKTLLSLSLTTTFPIKKFARGEKCDRRAWWISSQHTCVMLHKQISLFHSKQSPCRFEPGSLRGWSRRAKHYTSWPLPPSSLSVLPNLWTVT